jgi:spore maturation protein CgeB
MGHEIVFYERDVSYYAGARDLFEIPGGHLVLYPSWQAIQLQAREEVRRADATIVSSYCPDGLAATDLVVAQAAGLRVFYDLDTPVTLARLRADDSVPYIGSRGLRDFDLVLSFTGGPRLFEEFQMRLGARRIEALYGHVDPEVHRPVSPQPHYRADLSYLGTYSQDRQRTLEALFVSPARRRQDLRFLIGGAQYPQDFPWSRNIYFVRHLPPSEHAAFYASSRLTLNVTRRAMAEMGWCPSGRLFEAAACGTPILSDMWDGIGDFFEPGEEVLLAHDEEDALAGIESDDSALLRIARRARERTLDQHSSARRAAELIGLLEGATPVRAHELSDQEEV